jgi:hypothetical protein
VNSGAGREDSEWARPRPCAGTALPPFVVLLDTLTVNEGANDAPNLAESFFVLAPLGVPVGAVID